MNFFKKIQNPYFWVEQTDDYTLTFEPRLERVSVLGACVGFFSFVFICFLLYKTAGEAFFTQRPILVILLSFIVSVIIASFFVIGVIEASSKKCQQESVGYKEKKSGGSIKIFRYLIINIILISILCLFFYDSNQINFLSFIYLIYLL